MKVKDIIEKYYNDTVTGIETLEENFTKDQVLELLEQLVETGEYKEISAIKQPLGVIKFVLYGSTKGKCAQLHHWTDFKRDVHDHRYDFSSHILTGKANFIDYEEANQGEEFMKKTCIFKDNIYVTESETAVKLKPRGRFILPAGVTYFYSNTGIHLLETIEKGTVTFNFQSDILKNKALIYSKKNTTKNIHLSSDEILKELKIVIDILKK